MASVPPTGAASNDPAEAGHAAPASVPFCEALRFWLTLGCISFGGPAGQIALMHDELVERRRWISEGRFLHALNYCMLLPGPEAQQLATYIGWLLHGTRGGIAAGALFVLPSLVLLVGLSWLYVAAGHLPAIQGVLAGIKPAVIAIVAVAGWRIGSRSLRHPAAFAVALSAFLATTVLHTPFPWIIGCAALAGLLGARWWPGAFGAPAHTAKPGSAAGQAALIDDHTPPPPHARASGARLLTLAGLAIGLGLLAYAAVHFAMQGVGAGPTLTDMAAFFTKAALMTFGGAYAVLPYVVQGAVEQFGWLTAPQMLDGLALGETTPGPLIMVVAFVGFLGGWSQEALGSGAALAGGVAGAVVATAFTFLPSFAFILAGGPLVERTRGSLRVGAPLAGISAAVVGVIASLALYFARQVLWPGAGPVGLAGLDVAAAVICVAAAVAMLRYKVSVARVIAACAAIGWTLSL